MNAIQTSEFDSSGKNWKTKREIAGHFQCNVRTITKLMKSRFYHS